MKSIFKKRNPDVEKIFNDAKNPDKVMIVAFDYAKASHTSIICNGSGAQLKAPFNVINDKSGLDYLLDVIRGLCRKHFIQHKHVFCGGEDCGSFAFNFIHALIQKGYLVVGVNTKQAKDERENSQASTDLIDTVGIAGYLIKRRGRTIGIANDQVHAIKRLRRQRGAILKVHSSSAHRIYRIVDELFPGYMNKKLSGLEPFGRASIWLMRERFSIKEIHARQNPTLIRNLRGFSLGDPEGVAASLKTLCDNALPPSEFMIPSLQRSLAEEVELYELVTKNLHTLDTDIAKMLAVTPGAMLTTIQGINLRWAPAIFSELGNPARRRSVKRMAALAGLTPRLKQTGGPDKPAVIGHRSKNCSAFLKKIMMSSAVSVSQYGHPEIREGYQRDEAFGRDARTRLAKKLLRIYLYIMDNQTFFLPPSLHEHGTDHQLREYYAETWPKVLIKWRDAGAIKEATAEGTPLRKWRDMAQELYGLDLDLRSPQTGRK